MEAAVRGLNSLRGLVQRPRVRRALVRLLLLGGIVLALWLLPQMLISRERVAQAIHRSLSIPADGRVHVGMVSASLLSGIVIRDVRVTDSPDATPWASVGEFRLSIRLASLLRGRVDVTSVHLIGPRLVVSDTTLDRLRALHGTTTPSGSTFPAEIVVEQGEIRFQGTEAVPSPAGLTRSLLSVAGHVQYDSDLKTLTLRDVEGSSDGLFAEVDGTVCLASDSPEVRLRLHVDGVPLGDGLLEAAGPVAKSLKRELGVAGGAVGGSITILGHKDRGLRIAATLDFHDLLLRPRVFPYDLPPVAGRVHVSPDRQVRLEWLTGSRGSMAIQATGTVQTQGDGPATRILITATDVPNDAALREALPESVRTALDEAGLTGGTADIQLLLHGSGADLAVDADLSVSDASVKLKVFPYGLEGVHGSARWTSKTDTLALQSVTGSRGPATVTVSGKMTFGEKPRWRLVTDARSVVLDAPLRAALPEPLRKLCGRLQPSGVIDVRAVASATGPKSGVDVERLQVDFRNASFAAGLKADRVTGSFTAAPAHDDQGSTDVMLSISRARFADVPVQGLALSGTLSPGLLHVRDIDWQPFGGRVTGQLRLATGGEKPGYQGNLHVAHVDIESLVAAFADLDNKPSGWLRGSLEFRGQGQGLAGLEVDGTCQVSGGHLYEHPLMASLWNFLAFKLPGRGSLSDAHVQFRIRDSVLHIDHFLVTGSSMPVDMTGTITLDPAAKFEDQKIDLLFTMARGHKLLDRLPIIGWVKRQSYDQLTRYFVHARATGTLAHHKIQAVPKLRTDLVQGFWSALRLATGKGKVVDEGGSE